MADEHNSATNQTTMLQDSTPSCILCREHDDTQILGHLGFAQKGAALQRNNQSTAAHIHFCCHSMHLTCHAQYIQSLKARRTRMQDFEGQYVLSLDAGEFLCPMCKSVCNILVPHREHTAQHLPTQLPESQLVEQISDWYSYPSLDQLQPPTQAPDNESALAMASRAMAIRVAEVVPVSKSSDSEAVTILSHSWLSVSYMMTSVIELRNQSSYRPTMLAIRSLCHNLRALSSHEFI